MDVPEVTICDRIPYVKTIFNPSTATGKNQLKEKVRRCSATEERRELINPIFDYYYIVK